MFEFNRKATFIKHRKYTFKWMRVILDQSHKIAPLRGHADLMKFSGFSLKYHLVLVHINGARLFFFNFLGICHFIVFEFWT